MKKILYTAVALIVVLSLYILFKDRNNKGTEDSLLLTPKSTSTILVKTETPVVTQSEETSVPTIEPTVELTQTQATPPPTARVTPIPTPKPTQKPTPAPTVSITPQPQFINNKQFLVTYDRILEIFWYSKSVAQNYIDAVNITQQKLPGVKVYSLITPTAVDFYVPEGYKYGQSQKEAIDYIYSKLNDGIKKVDVYNTINKHLNEYVFLRFDHHWTQRGAYYAYTAFCKEAGLKAEELSSYKTGKTSDFIGSYFKYAPEDRFLDNLDYIELFFRNANNEGYAYNNIQMNNPTPIKVVRNDEEMKYIPYKYLAYINGDNPLSVFYTGIKNGKKIIVFKESYGNSLIPFLLSHYEEVYAVDVRRDKDINSDITQFIKDKGIQEVLYANYINSASASENFVHMLNMLK